MNKFRSLFCFLLLVFCFQVFACEAGQDINRKVAHLAKVLHSTTKEQRDELRVICQFIEENWDEWTKNPEIIKKYSYLRFQVTPDSWVTVHPNVPEVCIFLKGHTCHLGHGVFKVALKALSYVSLSEIAVAIPHAVIDKQAIAHLPSYWLDADKEEASMLEAVQGCGGVLELHFISYHWIEEYKRQLPIIISKYYNGGTLHKFSTSADSITLEEQLTICHDIMLGVKEIQTRGISHNDLHAGNILLEKDLKTDRVTGAVIADFGLARKSPHAELLYNFDTSGMYGHVLGILGWYSPGRTLLDSPVEKYLSGAALSCISAGTAYKKFVSLLPQMVDPQAVARIKFSANKKRSIKVEYDNIVKWR